MYTVVYYKIGSRWYLDAPDHLNRGGNPEDLERIGAFHEFLELAAAGESTVVFHMDTSPFEGADRFVLSGSSGGKTGGYYRLRQFRAQAVDLELWFNAMIYNGQAELPKTIYFRRITPP